MQLAAGVVAAADKDYNFRRAAKMIAKDDCGVVVVVAADTRNCLVCFAGDKLLVLVVTNIHLVAMAKPVQGDGVTAEDNETDDRSGLTRIVAAHCHYYRCYLVSEFVASVHHRRHHPRNCCWC